MHSKIIQMDTKPISPEGFITEDMFFDGFCGWIADYVSEVDKEVRDDVVNDFIEGFQSGLRDWVTVNGEKITFKKGFKEFYIEKLLQSFKDIAEKATVSSIKDGMLLYSLESLLGDPYGFYIYMEGYGLIQESRFLTHYVEEEIEYFFGGVIDYHY